MTSQILRPLSGLFELLAGLATTLMMVHILAGVVLRVMFDVSLLGTVAIVSYFYMVTMVFAGIFVVSWRQEHIRVDVVAELLPLPLRRITDSIAELACLVFFGIFAYGLIYTAVQKTTVHERVDAVFSYLTVWPLRWVAVAGISLAAVVSLWHLYHLAVNGRLPAVPGREDHQDSQGNLL